MAPTIPLFGPVPGGPELLIILLVLVLLFGANKIPKLARSTGQAMGEFKKGREEVEEELQQMQEGDLAEDEDATAGATGATADASETAEPQPDEEPAETETESATERNA